MKQDSRLSGILHVLLHMAGQEAPVTSERLAEIMRTNPVVIRRMLAGLRDQGYVRSEKGHGGGWTLDRDLASLTLLDIYRGIGSPSLFAIGHRNEVPGCAVERAVNEALGSSLHEAETLLLRSFAGVTLAELSKSFNRSLAACRPPSPGDRHEP